MSDAERSEEPHDILAAEEFAIGTPEERVPRDPTGIQEPHDVLAAEEFAMPAPGAGPARAGGGLAPRAWMPLAAIAGAVLLMLRRRRR